MMMRFLLSSASLALVLGVCGGAIAIPERAIAQSVTTVQADEAETQRLVKLAEGFHQAKEYDRAIEHYQKSLAVYQKTNNNQAAIAQVWINLGDNHFSLQQYPKTQESLQQALKIYQDTKNNAGMGDVENRIGNTYYRVKEYDKALGAYGRSLSAYQAAKNEVDTALVWSNIANAHWEMSSYADCLTALQKSLENYEKNGNNDRIAYIENWKGVTLEKLGQTSASIDSYQKALSAYQKTANQAGISNVYGNIAHYYETRKDFLNALKNYKKKLESQQAFRNPDRINEAYTLRKIARIHHYLKQDRESISIYLSTLKIFKEEKTKLVGSQNKYDLALTLWELGNCYFASKEYERSLQIYQESLTEYQGSPQDEADVLRNMSNSLRQLNRLPEAGQIYEQSLKKAQSYLKNQIKDPDESSQSSQQVSGQSKVANNKIQQQAEIEGTWQISRGQNSNGKAYTGTITMAKLKNMYRMFGDLSSGKRSGIGLLEGNQLFVGWNQGSNPSGGVFAYRINSDGSLWGRWAEASGMIGTDKWSEGKPGVIEGKYKLQGTNYTGVPYKGIVEIRRVGDAYEIFWNSDIKYKGIAIISGDYLVGGWDNTGNPGVAIYDIKDKQLTGQLLSFKNPRLSSESLIFNQKSLNTTLVEVLKLETEASYLVGVGKISLAIEKLQGALNLVQKNSNLQYSAKILESIGDLYRTQEQYLIALSFFQQALDISQKLNDQESEATVLNKIGTVYSRQGRYSQALEKYQKSLAIIERLRFINISDVIEADIIFVNTGSIYMMQGNYAQAHDRYKLALEISKQRQDYFVQGVVVDKIGSAYFEQGYYDLALKSYQDALGAFKKSGANASTHGITQKNIGLVYAAKGEYDKALSQYEKALVNQRSDLNRNQAEDAAIVNGCGSFEVMQLNCQ
ncbi:MAG: tetratricopeptide repeat protein [Alkalinema sp. RU_4_3]|nr:tetratricopeptide repeat protein [Alkalinema sp. RU_4_3]